MKNALEIASFKLKGGIATEDFLNASVEMEDGFAKKQNGFIKRTLAQNESGEWVDVVYWKTMDDATKAMESAMKSPACAPMFGMIDDASIKMSHFQIQNL